MAVTVYSFLKIRRPVEKSYEKVIVSYIRSSRCGDSTKSKVKIIASEARSCTVGDCIRIMMFDGKEEQAWAIAYEQKNLQHWKRLLESCHIYKGMDADWVQEEYRQQVERCLKLSRSTYPEKAIEYYEGWNRKEVLSVYVVCNYEVYLAEEDRYQMRTETFILTPDGKTVMGTEPHGRLGLTWR